MRIENILRPAAIVVTTAVAIICGNWHDLAAGSGAPAAGSALSVTPRSAPPVDTTQQFINAARISDGQQISVSNAAGPHAIRSMVIMQTVSAVRAPAIEVATIERLRSEPRPESGLLNPVRLDSSMSAPTLPPVPPESVAPPPTPKVGMFTRVKPALMADSRIKPLAIVGAFGDPLNAMSTPNTSRSATIAAVSSFGASPGSDGHAGATRSGVISGTSFGTNVVYAAPHGDSRRVVESAAFANTAFGSAKVPVSAGEPSYKPPVVMSEQQARYTADAQQARVQGEVTLKVRFLASGQVVVIGVVNGLGHGLDEEARHVAESIQFKPALQNGQPVDRTTLIHVMFQLV